MSCINEGDAGDAFVHRWFGIDRVNSQPSILGERVYDISAVGFKYHMNDFAAALGIGNLSDFKPRLERRQQIAKTYRENLENVPGLQLLKYEPDRTSAYWLFTLFVERREDFIRKLSEKGIPTSVVHLRIDHNSVFGGRRDLPEQAKFDEKQISIPVHEGLKPEDVDLIIRTITSGW